MCVHLHAIAAHLSGVVDGSVYIVVFGPRCLVVLRLITADLRHSEWGEMAMR